MMGGHGGGGGEGTSFEYTPTWVVAAVCTVMVAASLAIERFLHYAGKKLKKEGRKPLSQALQKVKEELMLLGFISLLLSVCQSRIVTICVDEDIMKHFLPCALNEKNHPSFFRHLLEDKETSSGVCAQKNQVPLISTEALHHLHIFIFVLAIVHVTFSVLTVIFGGAKIRQWKKWETSIKEEYSETPKAGKEFTNVRDHDFIMKRFMGLGKRKEALGWLKSFFKQFYGSVTEPDYNALRLGFIMTHCRGNRKFNFHKYMMRALEDDFRKVVGIRQVLLLAVGTKLEHVIIQLAHEVAERHVAIEGELVVKPSDEHFWFHRPKIVRHFIHFILFQNAFEIAFFFWILVQFGPHSCIMGKLIYIIPRLIIGAFVQILCSYSTLPLYALVTQMGSNFKKSMFDEHVQAGLISWAQKAKKKKPVTGTTIFSRSVGSSGDAGGQRDSRGDAELKGIHIASDSQSRTTNT
ncbi:hypothetical protein HanOQP8_Chr07g0244581 [Helianthus annuus]|nr:hypothetical protein HanOQP8_Chr07g0244581 [Helianthus annuus]